MSMFTRLLILLLAIIASPSIVAAQATCTTGRAELWFLNDESGSVDTAEFADAKSFMSSVAGGFTFSSTGFQGAIVSWSGTTDQTIESSLTSNFVSSVSNYTRNYSGSTAPAEALAFAAPYISSTARTGVPSVVVMLTDASGPQLTGNSANFISAANSIRATAGNEIVVMLIAEAAAAYGADATVKSTVDSVAGSASNVIVGSTYADIADPTKSYISALTNTTCSVAATAALALPGVSFPTSGQDLSATEGGDTASIPVVLNSQPTNDVTVTVADATGQCTFAPSTLTFTSSNYSTAQSITVTAVDDLAVEGSHSCTPVLTVTSTDSNYNGFDPSEPTVTIADNDSSSTSSLIDEVKDRVTDTLVEDFRRTVEMQQRSLSNISRDALLRMTESYDDLRCGQVEELDANGIAEFKNGVGILAGTINQDFYNCLSGERIIDEGEFSFTRTDNLGVEAMFSIRRQWEHIVDDDELRGRYLGVDFNNSNIDNGAGLSGSVKGFGISGGGYGAFTTDKELYVDYYFGGSAGIRGFNLDYTDAIGAVAASGDFTYGALFAGAALSGEKDMTDYVVTPRVGFDVALARASDANIQAERLNLTGVGTIVIPDHRIGNIYAEAIFSFGDEKPEENAMQDYWAYHVSPRAFCEFTSRSTASACGLGGYIEAKLYRYEQETDLGFRLDVSGTRNSRSMSIELLEERVIFGGLGTVTSTMGSALNGAMNVSTTLEMQY